MIPMHLTQAISTRRLASRQCTDARDSSNSFYPWSTPIMKISMLNRSSCDPLSSLFAAAILVLLTATHCSAARLVRGRLTCSDANPAGYIIPKEDDCRAVFAHLPAIRQDEHLFPLTNAVKAFPFVPPFTIGHSSCQFQFSWQHASAPQGQDGGRPPPVMPLHLIWRVMRVGAQRITNECAPNRQYGNFIGEAELEDEGVTRIFVGNFLTGASLRTQISVMERSRARLMGIQIQGADNGGQAGQVAFSHDVFQV